MWPFKTSLFFLGFIAACVLSLAHPIVGVCNYMLVYLVNPDKMWWGKPLAPLGIRYSLTAGVCLILGMVISSGRVPKTRAFVLTWEVLLILFAVTVGISSLIGTGTSDYGMVLLDKSFKMTIFLVCLSRMASVERNYRVVLWTLVIGSLVIGYDAFNAPSDDFANGRLNFVGGPDFRESSGLAAHMAATLPLIGAVFVTTRSWRWRIIPLVAGILTVNTVVQCRTRSAFVGLIAGACVALILAPRTRRIRVYSLLVVGALGLGLLADNRFWNRMSTMTDARRFDRDTTIQSRLELWTIAASMFFDHPLGVGIGQFRQTSRQYASGGFQHAFTQPHRVTHNSYLLCATELGIQGVLILMAILAVSVHRALRCFRLAVYSDDPHAARMLAYGSLIAVVIYAATSAFTDRLYTESFWWILTLPVCLDRALARQCIAREASEGLVDPADPETDGQVRYGETACPPHCALG